MGEGEVGEDAAVSCYPAGDVAGLGSPTDPVDGGVVGQAAEEVKPVGSGAGEYSRREGAEMEKVCMGEAGEDRAGEVGWEEEEASEVVAYVGLPSLEGVHGDAAEVDDEAPAGEGPKVPYGVGGHGDPGGGELEGGGGGGRGKDGLDMGGECEAVEIEG